MKTIKVKFTRGPNDLKLLGKVIRKYIDWNGSLPEIKYDFEITRMKYHPYKPKKGKMKIMISMELSR